MPKLGIVKEHPMDEKLINIFQTDEYSLSIVEKKGQFDQLDGVIVPLTQKEHLPKVIDWLIFCKKEAFVFAWVYSTISLDYEQELLIELGANGVIENEKNLGQFAMIVKNTLLRLEKMVTNKKEEITQDWFNKQNQSLIISGKEVSLTKKEYRLLVLLCEQSGNCVCYEELMLGMWPNAMKKKELLANKYRLSSFICQLRKKLKKSNMFTIKTVQSKGYLLIENKKA